MLRIENLHATVADKPILKGITLAVNAGEVHAIVGPNGAGKSTLGYVLGGREGYQVTEGSVTFEPPLPLAGGVGGGAVDAPASPTAPPLTPPGGGRGIDLLAMEADERAAAGLFLGFQYPVEIPGVSNVQFLRTA